MVASSVIYEYLPKQAEFMQYCDYIPYVGYIGGFGSGKTHVLSLQGLRWSTQPSRGLIGAPTYRMLADTTQRKFFELCPTGWLKDYRKSDNIIRLINNTEILFRSLENPGALASLELDWFLIDEMGETSEETFRMLQGRLRRVGGIHRGAGVGNPAGPAHWTYKYFVKLAQEYPAFFKLVQATSYENTFLDPMYTKTMEISFDPTSAYFQRYVMGQFCAFEGAYWGNFNPINVEEGGHTCRPDQLWLLLDKKKTRWGRVIDFGFEHPFVCMHYATDGDCIVFLDEYWMRHGTIRHHILAIRQKEYEHSALWGFHTIGTTYTDHDATCRNEIENCQDQTGHVIGFPCEPADKQVFESIMLVQTLFERHKLFICAAKCPHALLEIPSYRAKERRTEDRTGGSVKEEPIKINDDTCDCLKMACLSELAHHLEFLRFRGYTYHMAIEQEYETTTPHRPPVQDIYDIPAASAIKDLFE